MDPDGEDMSMDLETSFDAEHHHHRQSAGPPRASLLSNIERAVLDTTMTSSRAALDTIGGGAVSSGPGGAGAPVVGGTTSPGRGRLFLARNSSRPSAARSGFRRPECSPVSGMQRESMEGRSYAKIFQDEEMRERMESSAGKGEPADGWASARASTRAVTTRVGMRRTTSVDMLDASALCPSMVRELTAASRELSDRGFLRAAQWAAEMTVAAEDAASSSPGVEEDVSMRDRCSLEGGGGPAPEDHFSAGVGGAAASRSTAPAFSAESAGGAAGGAKQASSSSKTTQRIQNLVFAAKTHFDLRQHWRAFNLLMQEDSLGGVGRCLKWHALYLAGEGRKESENLDSETEQTQNREVESIDRQKRCAQRAGGIAGRGVLGRREGGREGGAGDSAQRAARSAQWVGWMLWNSVERWKESPGDVRKVSESFLTLTLS